MPSEHPEAMRNFSIDNLLVCAAVSEIRQQISPYSAQRRRQENPDIVSRFCMAVAELTRNFASKAI
jgi:hypothetical protein